jgi:hypothetical protein
MLFGQMEKINYRKNLKNSNNNKNGQSCGYRPTVATQDRVFPYYVPNSSIKLSKSDSKDRSQEIL